MIIKNFLSIFWLLSINLSALLAQNNELDSLQNLLKTARHDTTRFNAFMELGNYFKNSNPDTALYFYAQAEKLSEKIPGAEGELRKGETIRQRGRCNYLKGNYESAIEYYEKSILIAQKYLQASKEWVSIRTRKLLSTNLINIGNVYSFQGNHGKALDCYFKALKIFEEIGNERAQANILGDIGIVYSDQGNNNKAMEYYSKALKINDKIGNKHGKAINLGNIGIIYMEQGDYTKALEYYQKALNIYEEIGNKRGQAAVAGNIGSVYNEQRQYNKAIDFYLKALKIYEEIKNKRGQAINLSGVGTLYTKLKKFKEAEAYLKKAEQMHREMHTINYLKDACAGLSELYEQTGRYKEALYYHKEYIKARDSVLNEENQKAALIKDMQYKYEKEQIKKEAAHKQQLAEEKALRDKQRLVTWAITAGLAMVVVFLVVVWNRLKVTRKQKKIIESQKQIVEQQKRTVEEKNKDIMDSITYARRIQQAILPSAARWQALLPDSFVLYLPKDIVAGDFYWMEENENYIYVAAADCTGHGVPGAMVSVVCSSALTKAVLEEKLTETDQILNRVRDIVIEKLTSEENIRDGMDVCLIRVTKGRNTIQYSGANRPLYIIQPTTELIESSNNFLELKPDKQPIGRYEESKLFTKQEIVLPQNSMLYLSTDGYADQFGGEKGKKISVKTFKELLTKISTHQNINKQKDELYTFFQQWKGNEEQMDDVTVLGVRI